MRIPRRSFLEMAAFSAAAGGLPAQVIQEQTGQKPAPVLAGEDREARKRAVGVSSTAYKVLTAETGGSMFAMEQMNHKKGGPNRHLHHGEDELFYVMEGEYAVEVGESSSISGPVIVCSVHGACPTPGPLWEKPREGCC